MGTRAELKFKARKHLAGKYGDALGVAVVASLISGGVLSIFSLGSSRSLLPSPKLPYLDGLSGIGEEAISFEDLLNWLSDYLTAVSLRWRTLVLGFLVLLLVTLLYRILVANVMQVGRERWYLRAAQPDVPPPFSMSFSLFHRGEYGRSVGGMLWRSIWLLVWTLIPSLILLAGMLPVQWVILYAVTNRVSLTEGLIIRLARQYGLPAFLFSPAMTLGTLMLALVMTIVMIRKRYSYRLVPYLLADNPFLGGRRALKLSRAMTRGQIGRLFLLDLSFLGWILLCLMCICLPWVTLHLFAPYYLMTWAETYQMLRDQAAARGIVQMEELGYVRVS